MHDLVIKGATVADGTGSDPVVTDVAVVDGVIVEVGRVVGSARRTIEADGLLLTPGFIDIHTHFDGQATWDAHVTPSCWHGVTTAILGNCGIGFAPAARDQHDRLIELMEGIEDIPGTALHEGINWDWESFPEYLDALERFPRAVDVGTHVPHTAVRAFVMGDRALQDATSDDIAAMHRIVGDSMRAGALGFSTGRTTGHRDVHGGIVPGTFAAPDELRALLSAMEAVGRGVFQIVPHGIGGVEGGDGAHAMDDELAWLLPMAEATSLSVTYLAMQSHADPDGWRPWFERTRAANARGAHLRPQVASRCFGMLMGHQSRMNPFKYRPTYQQLADLPFGERIAQLRNGDIKARILAEVSTIEGPGKPDQTPRFNRLYPLGSPLNYEPTADQSVAAIARREGRDPWEVMYDLFLGADGREFLLFPLLNYAHESYDGLYEMMTDPMTVQGLGDGGAHCAIVCDASMTTFMLSHWARDRTRGPQIPLGTAVRRLTRDPAELYGLADRGVIAPGKRADLNLIDFDRLALQYPEHVTDLPAGAGRLIQRSEGYVETLVRGETIVDNGELTDARPGALVRGGRR